MQVKKQVSLQDLSWVKSNNKLQDKIGVEELFYPETKDEFLNLIDELAPKDDKTKVPLIGFSSNTLFLPTYHVDKMICTRKFDKWEVRDNVVVCDCGVNVSKLAKYAVSQGWKGFYGLVDLPGTIAAAVYGNAGCYDCTVNNLLESFELLLSDGTICHKTIKDLDLEYRSTSLKKGTLKGIILSVVLKVEKGNAEEEQKKADNIHADRLKNQPNAANNLGTTYVLLEPKFLGKIFLRLIDIHTKKFPKLNHKQHVDIFFKLFGQSRFVPYTYGLGRFMFVDEKSHEMLSSYTKFLKKLFSSVVYEIEFRS
ncbi:MAG: FAD-binding protein [Paludibacteraceae bacterium]|nr:FAD-binding protein [Paludibacteraceae bacterium]